jgi:hypothetical protein
MTVKVTKKDYEEWMNELGTPDLDLASNGGRIPDRARYGSWVRRNDPIAFNVGFREFELESQHPRRRK